jgi:hypothetical protein
MAVATASDATWKNWVRSASPWKGPLLALLLESPGHAYELRSRLIKRLRLDFDGRFPDAYRLLEQAQALGLARSVEEASQLKRKTEVCVYEATELTADAHAYWMDSPLTPEFFRSGLLMRLLFAREQDLPALLRACDEYERSRFEIAVAFEREFSTNTWDGLLLELARLAVLLPVQAELSWLEHTRKRLRDFMEAPGGAA